MQGTACLDLNRGKEKAGKEGHMRIEQEETVKTSLSSLEFPFFPLMYSWSFLSLPHSSSSHHHPPLIVVHPVQEKSRFTIIPLSMRERKVKKRRG